MGKQPALSPTVRSWAVRILQAGSSTYDVARTFWVAQGTVSKLIERYRKTNSVSDRPRSGRSMKIRRRQFFSPEQIQDESRSRPIDYYR